MLREFVKKKKFLDYINITNREVSISLILTLMLTYYMVKLGLFENFKNIRIAFQNISLYIASGQLSMIGIILTGLALMLGVLDKKVIKEINNVNKDINDFMLCFKFLIFNLGLSSILFFFIHFMLFVEIYIPKKAFYTMLGLSIYYFIFLVFYTIDLVSSSIDLYLVKNITDKIAMMELDGKENKINNCGINNLIDKIKLEYLMREHNARSHTKFFYNINKVIDDIRDIDEVTKTKLKKIFKDTYDKRDL